jgi:hypothetical protein
MVNALRKIYKEVKEEVKKALTKEPSYMPHHQSSTNRTAGRYEISMITTGTSLTSSPRRTFSLTVSPIW